MKPRLVVSPLMKALLAGSRKRKGTECNFKAEGFNKMRYKVYLKLKA